jgi:hypothetical protein
VLVVAAMVYTVQKSAESNKQFGNSLRAFTSDAQHYVEQGGTGPAPTIKPTGDATIDWGGRVLNGIFQEVASVIARMNKELNDLDEKNVFETSVLTNKASLEGEASKRIESQRIIAKYQNDLPRVLDPFPQKLASYNMPDGLKKNAVAGFEDARLTVSHRYETMFNLLGKKEKTELDFLYFMNGAFNEYDLKDGKISFRSPMTRQRYRELTKSITDTAEEIAAFRKEWRDDVNANIQKLSR